MEAVPVEAGRCEFLAVTNPPGPGSDAAQTEEPEPKPGRRLRPRPPHVSLHCPTNCPRRGPDRRYAAMTMPPCLALESRSPKSPAALQRVGAQYALIGGLALAAHRVIRATQDVDLLTAIEKADEIEAELIKLGYHRLHRSADAGNYSRADERVDLLYAHRPIARRLLAGADELKTSLGDLPRN